MQHYLIMCKSLTYAQRAARTLERTGIAVAVVKAPQPISQEGCAYCVRVPEKRLKESLRSLEAAAMQAGKVYAVSSDMNVREV